MKTIEATSVDKKGRGRKKKKAVQSPETSEYTSVDNQKESVNTSVNSENLPEEEKSSESGEYTSVYSDKEAVNTPVNSNDAIPQEKGTEQSGLQDVDKNKEAVNKPISSLVEFLSEETQYREEHKDEKQKESETESEEDVSKRQAKAQAEFTVAFLDTAQRFVLPILARKKILGSLPQQVIERVKERVQNLADIEGLTEEEKRVWERIILYEEYVKTLPFTKEEKKLLTEPLTEIYLKYGIKMAPEIRLLIALGTVMGTRFIPLFAKY